MVDSVQVWPPGTRFIDAFGAVLAGGYVEFYDAGTSNAKTVYSDSGLTTALGSIVHLDSGGAPVSEQGGSTKVTVYTGIDPYKVVIKDSAGVVVETKDNILGAFDSASILETLTLIPETEVETLTDAVTLTADDVGQIKNCNSTGGAFAVTLPDATGLNRGARIGFRMAGTANSVTVKSTSSQTIARAGITSTSFALTKFGESVWLVNDGGNWLEDTYVPPLHGVTGVIVVADRTATPPVTPAAGARYILTSGPDDAWSSYTEHDVVEADGNGGWFRYTPAADCGWIAYVQDEDAYYWFVGSAWTQLTATDSVAGTIQIATQAEMETGTATNRAVTPGRQHYHPAHPKAWGYVTVSAGTPTLAASHNVTGITDAGTGLLTVTIDTDFADANYCIIAAATGSAGGNNNVRSVHVTAQAAGSFTLEAFESESGVSIVDPAAWHFACFGDQA